MEENGVEAAKRFNNTVNPVTKGLWMKVLATGTRGLLTKNILTEYTSEGISPSIVKAAIENLENSNLQIES